MAEILQVSPSLPSFAEDKRKDGAGRRHGDQAVYGKRAMLDPGMTAEPYCLQGVDQRLPAKSQRDPGVNFRAILFTQGLQPKSHRIAAKSEYRVRRVE